VSAFDLLSSDSDAFPGTARFNAFTSAVSNAEFLVVPPGEQAFLFPLAIDRAELALTPARGWMVFTPDNPNGPGEAQLINLPSQ
jgi:minor extracellular serine protease Vpr